MGEGFLEMLHARVGEIRVREDTLIHFDGLPGFPEARRFALIPEGEEDGSFQWLACLDDPALAFVVTDPKLFFPDYAPAVPRPQLRALGARSADEVVLLAIANLAGDVPRLNLAAPLVVHLESRRAAQALLDDPELGIAEPLPGTSPVAQEAAGAGESNQTESKPQT